MNAPDVTPRPTFGRSFLAASKERRFWPAPALILVALLALVAAGAVSGEGKTAQAGTLYEIDYFTAGVADCLEDWQMQAPVRDPYASSWRIQSGCDANSLFFFTDEVRHRIKQGSWAGDGGYDVKTADYPNETADFDVATTYFSAVGWFDPKCRYYFRSLHDWAWLGPDVEGDTGTEGWFTRHFCPDPDTLRSTGNDAETKAPDIAVDITTLGSSGALLVAGDAVGQTIDWEVRTFASETEWCIGVVDPTGQAEACSGRPLDQPLTIQTSIGAHADESADAAAHILTTVVAPTRLRSLPVDLDQFAELLRSERPGTLSSGQNVFVYSTVNDKASSVLISDALGW